MYCLLLFNFLRYVLVQCGLVCILLVQYAYFKCVYVISILYVPIISGYCVHLLISNWLLHPTDSICTITVLCAVCLSMLIH